MGGDSHPYPPNIGKISADIAAKLGAYRHNIRRYRRAYGEKRGLQYPPFASCICAPRAQRDTADNADKAPEFLRRERSEIRRILPIIWRILAQPIQGICSPLLPFFARLRWLSCAARPARNPPRATPQHPPRTAAAPQARGAPPAPRAGRALGGNCAEKRGILRHYAREQ